MGLTYANLYNYKNNERTFNKSLPCIFELYICQPSVNVQLGSSYLTN